MINNFRLFLGLALALLFAGCAHTSPLKDVRKSPVQILKEVCSIGETVQEARGNIWLSVQSPDRDGKFPADVKAVAPDQVKIQITNPFGGVEAQIQVTGPNYYIQIPGRESQNRFGGKTWGGIPLEWATSLFLGRLPCPPAHQAGGSVKALVSAEGELVVEVLGGEGKILQEFVYRFRENGQNPRPEGLIWTDRGADNRQVNFEFGNFEDETQSPLQWSARSDHGEVKVKWNIRKVKTQR